MSTSLFRRRNDEINKHKPVDTRSNSKRMNLHSITDDDNHSNEPSLTNSSVSTLDVSRQGPLHTSLSLPLHPTQSSLLDMTRDSSQDDTQELSMEFGLGSAYHSPDTSLIDEEEDDDFSNCDEDDHAHPSRSQLATSSSDSFSLMGRGLANISESMSGSFCTQGKEVNTSCVSDCTAYVSDKVSSKNMPFADRILQNRLMNDFHYLLGSDSSPCSAEKSLFCFGKKDAVNDDSMETILFNEKAVKIRNRAGESWRARAYRIKRLTEERMMQESGLIQSMESSLKLDSSAPVTRSTSFNHFLEHRQRRFDNNLMKPKQEVNVEPLGCMIGDCIEPISPLEGDQANSNDNEDSCHDIFDEQDLCYDSDPGIATYHRTSETKSVSICAPSTNEDELKRPTNATRSKSDQTSSHRSPLKKWFKSPRRRRRKMHFDSFDDAIDAPKPVQEQTELDNALDMVRSKFYGKTDESFDDFDTPQMPRMKGKRASMKMIDKDMKMNVQNMLNHSWTLTLHPPSSERKNASQRSLTRSSSMSTPRCIKLWFERGNRIRRNDILEPKLMWRDAFHPDLSSQRKLNKSTTNGPTSVCLLNICRIIETKTLDREKYPFAKTSCSFLIRTSEDEEYVFEAASEKQRNEIVYNWKLVVARLAAQAVVGDGEGMVGEFFIPSSFGVP